MMRFVLRRNCTYHGMTLIEALMAIAIFTLLSLVITTSLTNLYQYNAYTIEQSDEVENARNGMTRWNRDVKEMTTAEDGNYPLVVVEPHRLGYYSDTDQDDSVEYIEYVLATTTLYKYTYDPTGTPATYDLSTPDRAETLSLYVQNIAQATSTFFYYDDTGTELSTTSPIIDVRLVTMQLIVNVDPLRAPGEFMLKSSVAPRNLKDNL